LSTPRPRSKRDAGVAHAGPKEKKIGVSRDNNISAQSA
jgi:hypothetical protein